MLMVVILQICANICIVMFIVFALRKVTSGIAVTVVFPAFIYSTREENRASNRLAEALGFTVISSVPKTDSKDGHSYVKSYP